MSYKFPCEAPSGAHPWKCEKCEDILDDVVARLKTATDSELGEMLAAFVGCRVYTGTGNTPCRRRPNLPTTRYCKPCLVRREVDHHIELKKGAKR